MKFMKNLFLLIEHLIKLFSKKGSLVVDPFLGSGTTALACKNTDRKFFVDSHAKRGKLFNIFGGKMTMKIR